jgi:dienelactone hydrolase
VDLQLSFITALNYLNLSTILMQKSMKSKLLFFFFLVAIGRISLAQLPEEIYAKPLKDVLTDVAKRYKIKFEYDTNDIAGVEIRYPTWRYRVDIEQTLTNVLYPADFIFQKKGNNTYQVSKFEYWQRSPAEGKLHLDKLLESYTTLPDWEARKETLRKCFLEQLGLSPFPRKTPLNPIYTKKRSFDGYTVENVAIETLPGVFLCGSLYKPLRGKGPFAAVLSPHGHFSSPDMNQYGRYRPDQQYRCAMLARMGAVVFSYEMFAWGESMLQVDKEVHKTALALTMQTLNSIRVLDFLTSLPFVDQKRIGVTGESGGGTQTFLVTALDDRIAVSVPVVMVSSYFYGGCACESGLPIHSCSDMGTNNAEIAAMASPRPMLVISDGSDWTRDVPVIEFPYLQKVYSLYGRQSDVENVHLENEAHDYGISKRKAMYDFMARHLHLDLNAAKNKSGEVDETKVTIEDYRDLLVFGLEGKLPENALKGPDAIRRALKSLQ